MHPRRLSSRIHRRQLLGLGAGALAGLLLHGAARAGVELTTLQVARADGGLLLEFVAQVSLPRAVEEALQRGVPIYFTAQATLWRSRWYWRDERIARVTRNWRLVYQPLTRNWRVSLGALGQSYATLDEALAVISRAGGWRLADAGQLEAGERYYVEFSYRLDTAQLPRPMQFGAAGDWTLGTEHTVQLRGE